MTLATAGDGYFWRAGEALDLFLNVILLNGVVEQSISRHAASARDQNYRWGCVLCRWLSWTVERDHCTKTLQHEALIERAGLLAGLQLLMLFMVLTGIFWFAVLR